MDKQFTKKTIKEYVDILQTLSEQAKQDKKVSVSNFLDSLLEKNTDDIELFDFIYKSADELSEELVEIYMYMLSRNLPIEWYVIASFIHEERDESTKYFEVMKKYIELKNDINVFQDIIYQTDSFDEFKIQIEKEFLAEKEDVSNPEHSFIDHLRGENEELRIQIASLFEELKCANNELTGANKTIFELKSELNRLDHESKKYQSMSVAHTMLEKKFEQIQVVNAQLEKVNEYLQDTRERDEKLNNEIEAATEELESKNEKLKQQVNELEEIVLKLEEQLIEKDSVIESLQTSVSDYEIQIKDYENQIYSAMYSKEVSREEVAYVPDNFSQNDKIVEDKPEGLIEIKDNTNEVIKHTNVFANIILKTAF